MLRILKLADVLMEEDEVDVILSVDITDGRKQLYGMLSPTVWVTHRKNQITVDLVDDGSLMDGFPFWEDEIQRIHSFVSSLNLDLKHSKSI